MLHRTRARLHAVASLVAAALIAVPVVALSPASPVSPLSVAPSASAAAPFMCDQNTIYGVSGTGQVRSIDATTGAMSGDITDFPQVSPDNGINALGLTNNGLDAYAFDRGGRVLHYDPVAGTQDVLAATGITATEAAGVIRGAINPVNGIFYFGVGSASAGLWAFDTRNDTMIGRVGTINGLLDQMPNGNPANGDFAFSSQGLLFVVTGDRIMRVVETLPVTSGNEQLSTRLVADLEDDVNSPGIAFTQDGYLFVSSGTNMSKLDPVTGDRVGQAFRIGDGSFQPSDLASCNYPNTITVQKDLGGRVQAGDQFALSITGGGIQAGNTATTAGTANGIQPQRAGAVLTVPNASYTVTETSAGTANLANYTSSLQCVNINNPSTPIVYTNRTATSATFTFPAAQQGVPDGTDVVCTFSNQPIAAGLTLTKSADPASGTTVQAGQTVTYTVRATNTGSQTMTAQVRDDLADVLSRAQLVGTPTATIDGTAVAAPTLTGTTLTWNGSLAGTKTVELRYSVRLAATAVGGTIDNSATATGTIPNRPTLTAGPATTSHPVATPGFTIAKSATPASGSVVEPGQLVTYSVTGANTGQTSLDAVVADDLADLLSVGAIEGTPTATIGGTATTAPTVSGDELRWTGALAAGQSVVVTYAIRIDADAPSGTLDNVATGSATPPGGTTITPPEATTTHPLQSPGFTLTKTATPASGTAVEPGATITYAVTGTNDGDTSLSTVVTDDLADVLAHATLQGAPTATIDGQPATAPTLDGTMLRWQGTLAADQVVRLAYTVVVDGDAGGQTLVNGATATATSPGGSTTEAPEVSTTHPVLTPGFAFTKTSEPGTGTAVDPGATIAYTLTGANTGQTRLVDVTVTDDLSDVLDDADVTVQPTARVDGELVTAPTIVDGILTWTGDLAVDESVVISYSVVVRGDTGGETIGNSATGSATPPGGGTPIEPEPETTTHPVRTSGFTFAKTSTPGTGSAVDPGATVAYALTGVNTGETALSDVTIVDDLSDVLDDATISVDPEARIDGELADAQPELAGTTLTWTGDLAVGETVVVTYSVLVGGDAGGATLANVATASATPPGGSAPIQPEPGTTTHDVNEPGFTLAKTADPESGSAVDPGATIAYTITGANSGETALDPVTIVDDLSDVLDGATLSVDPEARIGDETVVAPVLEGTTLTWTGELAVGESVVITYSVVVGGDAGGTVIANAATASATPPGGGTPIVPDPVDTTHDVNEPGFDLTKTVEPGSGTAIDPGATLAYTVTGSNVGETALDPVVITDDMTDVLDDARMSVEPEARIGGELAETQPVLEDAVLTWTGRLAVGESVVITYSVVVTGDAGGAVIANSATGHGTPPGGGTPITPDEVDGTENDVNEPGFTLAKTADPASGAAVDAASVVTYTITGTNTGETALDPVSIVDDLSGVLDDATITTAPTATIGDEPATAPIVDGTTLTWQGRLEVGQAVTITYAVTVDADAGGSLLENSATASATPPGGATPLVPEPVETANPVNLPGFSLTKAADPVSGTAVDPGDVVTYALTGTNTGETGLTDVTIVDDLSQVLAHADLGELDATIDGEPVEPPVLDGTTLTWIGDLAVGETVVVTYDVTVHADAGGATLGNAVTGSATPPGGIAIVPPTSTTEHPVDEPGFALTKTADPESGSAVDPGTTITYTVTGENTGETVLDRVVIDDDLTDVLAGADLVGEPVATIGDQPADAPVVDGTMLTWTGALQVGETVTLVYQVVVHEDAGGTILRNHASAVATPPGGLELVPEPVETVHDVNESGFTLVKTADHGAIVAVGDVIRFAVTATNTGETTLDVHVDDDLSAVLAGATLDAAPTATLGDAPVVDDETIRWSGTLAPGEQVVIEYSVTVSADGAGLTLRNVATARASGPGGDITPPPATTETRVQPPLPRTGAEVAAPIAAVALLLMLAGAALAIRRRREA